MKNDSSNVDIIYNATYLCSHNCKICCVDAISVRKKDDNLILANNNFSIYEKLTLDKNVSNLYQQAEKVLIQKGLELNIKQKKQVVDNLEGYKAKIDISGGDALLLRSNYELLKYASKKLGKEKVTLTVTGLGVHHLPIREIAKYIGEYNFTYDAESIKDVANRPPKYSKDNLIVGSQFAKIGCSTRAELPLTKDILHKNHLERLYKKLNENNIDKLLLMRLFPVGRGVNSKTKIPTKDEYLNAIDVLSFQESKYKKPRIKLQCALKYLCNNNLKENPCDLVRNSFGVMPDGTLLASPWAYAEGGKAISDVWILGNLYENKLSTILASPKAHKIHSRSNENIGHCKLFAYLNSDKIDEFDRMFDKSDPLYKKTCNMA